MYHAHKWICDMENFCLFPCQPVQITGFFEAKHGNFRKTIFGNMPYENYVISTFLLIRCHIETDYYQEEIHFDYNRRKKCAYWDSNSWTFGFKINCRWTGWLEKKQKVLDITNLLLYMIQKTVCWYLLLPSSYYADKGGLPYKKSYLNPMFMTFYYFIESPRKACLWP